MKDEHTSRRDRAGEGRPPPRVVHPDARVIVFDWDGTVVDSVAGIVRALQRAAEDLGLAVPDDRRARHVIGLGLDDALRHAVPDLPIERRPAFVERYRAHFLARGSVDEAFPGMPDLLAALAGNGLELAVATGKSRAGLDRALRDTGLAARFVATRCADEGFSKPHPWMLQSLSEALDVEPSRMLMIGDTSHDIAMARAAGVCSIGVVYGAHDPEDVAAAGPDAIAGSVEELADLLGAGTPAGSGTGWRRLCESTRLAEGGDGFGFDLAERPAAGGSRMRERGFVVRVHGGIRGFVNRCAHVPIELDWQPGRFLDESGTVVLCSTHGAAYDPTSGRCLDGPCRGRGGLQPLDVIERDGVVWLRETNP